MLFSQLQHPNMQFLKTDYISENWETVLMLLFQQRQLPPDREEICIFCDYASSFMLPKFVVLFILEWVESKHIIVIS